MTRGEILSRDAHCSWRRTLLRRLRVILDRRAGADQIAIAIDIVDAADRAPVFVGARRARRKAALGAAIGPCPGIIGDVVDRVRRVPQRRGLDLPAALL